MISLSSGVGAGLREYGIKHFKLKYGIPIKSGDESPIEISYGKKSGWGEKFYININSAGEQVPGKVAGYVHFKNGKVPSFEEIPPLELKGEILASYFCGDINYPCAILDKNIIEINFDIFKSIGSILCGYLDEVDYTVKEKKNAAKIPILDIYERFLFDCLITACSKLRIPLVSKALWPKGARFAVCLTHDVDEFRKTYQYITRPVMALMQGSFLRSGKLFIAFLTDVLAMRNPYNTFDSIMELESSLGVKSSFYFIEEKGKVHILSPKTWKLAARRYSFTDPDVSKIIKKLDSRGWDVGLHGSYFSYKNGEMLKREKDRLEEVLGHPISGVRQHHLNLEHPETWRIHESCGIEYDSSLGFKETIGFKWGTCFPFHPLDAEKNRRQELIEIPITIMDTPLIQPRGKVWDDCASLLDTVAQYGGVLTLLWHHTVFDDRVRPGWTETYRRLISESVRRGAWVTDAKNISSWWKKREDTEVNTSYTKESITLSSRDDSLVEVYCPLNVNINKKSFNVIKEDVNSIVISLDAGRETFLELI